MAKKNAGGLSRKQAIGIGAGLAAAAVAAAGAYFLYGKRGAQNRKKVRGWMLKAKGEILERLEQVKDLNREKYEEIVDTVIRRYRGVKGLDGREISRLVTELKSYWGNISRARGSAAPKRRPARKRRRTS